MRIENEKGFIPFEVEALTPVHIGSGEDFSPLEYILRQSGESEFEVLLIDTASWLSDCASDPKIARALDTGDMAALRALLNASTRSGEFALAKIPVNSVRIGKELLQKRNRIENRAEIMTFARNPFTHMPFIPASSLKGAISTAIINYVIGQHSGLAQKLRNAPREYKIFLEKIFGKINEHAMKALRIADIPLPPGMTSIRGAIGCHLSPEKQLPKTPCEALNPVAVNSFRITGSLRITDGNGFPAIRLRNTSPITAPELANICNQFFRQKFKAEYDKFYTKSHFQPVRESLESIVSRIDSLDDKNEILLRVGRYSHIECMTISGPPLDRPKGDGKSRTLADGQIPFGWVLLKYCSMDKYVDSQNRVAAAIEKDIEDRREFNRSLGRKQQEANARALMEAEAAQAREKALAAMTPEERAIWELEQDGATENQASALYAKLKEMGDLQDKAAMALMCFWQRLGKWEGKQLTKKQKEKVATVRLILDKMRG